MPDDAAVPDDGTPGDAGVPDSATRRPREVISLGPAGPPYVPEISTEELLARVARGDGEAFEAVYRRLADPVFGLVLQVVRDRAQSEEVAQEVLVEVWRSASRFDPSLGSARAWVLTMARRRAIDRVRAAQAASDRDRRVVAGSHTIEFDEVVEAVEGRLERRQVRRCLQGLTEVQRESVTLAFYRGYTQNEVSRLLGLPLGTVKTRLRDGLIRLRDCLGVMA
jgi:RNA polymerase sigma-70 factor (ECF subfamily)